MSKAGARGRRRSARRVRRGGVDGLDHHRACPPSSCRDILSRLRSILTRLRDDYNYDDVGGIITIMPVIAS
jgi:hypothetical protein